MRVFRSYRYLLILAAAAPFFVWQAANAETPVPVITTISPNPIPYGSFDLSITGSGFVQGAAVNFGGTALPTTFVSSTNLTATGTAVPVIGALMPITIVNPGSISSLPTSVKLMQSHALVPYASAFHFLEQATFGPTPAAIDQLQQIGYSQWFTEQFGEPISQFTPNAPNIAQLQSDLFYNALTGSDQLRQRVVLALSELFVISGFKDWQASTFEPYLQILQQDAFGNFYNLMNDVTLSPSMGYYLDMGNNVKGASGALPNENYARELMQLFTTGPILLNANGTPQLNSSGATIPVYTETTIQNFARVFTGWTYPVMPGATPEGTNPPYYVGPMVAWAANHDTGSKTLLNGLVLPAGQTAQQDLTATLQNIFTHPNVPPFIATMLIQHLVSSNPSPAYVQRVANVFINDGTGTRGNLRSVIEAILTDPEARDSDSPTTWISTGGHLREPILFITSVLRNLNATATDSNELMGISAEMGQAVFYPESVSSYFAPDYTLPGSSTLLGPEFDTVNSSSGLYRVNWINAVSWGGAGSDGVTLSSSSFLPLAADPTGVSLTKAMSNTFMAGQMPQDMETAIEGVVVSLPHDPQVAVASAIYLTASSGLYQVQH
jgi:uncharacterized protein (DUF1800 family)